MTMSAMGVDELRCFMGSRFNKWTNATKRSSNLLRARHFLFPSADLRYGSVRLRRDGRGACAARRAASLRSSGVRFAAVARPPSAPISRIVSSRFFGMVVIPDHIVGYCAASRSAHSEHTPLRE